MCDCTSTIKTILSRLSAIDKKIYDLQQAQTTPFVKLNPKFIIGSDLDDDKIYSNNQYVDRNDYAIFKNNDDVRFLKPDVDFIYLTDSGSQAFQLLIDVADDDEFVLLT